SLAIARGVPFAGAALGQATTLGRLDPHPEAIRFDVSRLARQLRLWETEAALAQREASAEPSQAADLRYKRAALFFYQPDALFPAYARYRRCAEDVLSLWIYEPTDKDSYEAAITSFAQSAQGWSRCATLLAGFETRYPTYAGLDEALFTRGLCFERLLRSGWCRDQEGVIKTLVSALETLTTTCPESPLSDDAGRAARYWRSNWSEFFPPPSPGR
ncbi:MAG: hypothetical protein JKY65_13170, partial [Planctomycetes bacterium]|nr:hypothetical protein [Planctomycetota bacterium]